MKSQMRTRHKKNLPGEDDVDGGPPTDDNRPKKKPRRPSRETWMPEKGARTPLTQRNLRLLEKMAKKGMAGTKSESATESISEASTKKTCSSRRTSDFAVGAIRNGILPVQRSKAPENIAEIRGRYSRERETASPTRSMYEYYVDSVQTAANEATMVTESANDLLKRYAREGYKKAYNQAFTGLPKDVGFNSGLSAPQPDFVEGLLVEEFEPFPIATAIRGGELFKDNPNSLAVPHIAGEWKGPGKNMELARLQSSYDGAALVFGRQQALSYLDQDDAPGHAHITTFTTDGTQLNMFAHYADTDAPGGQTKYHQFPIKSVNLLESYASFKAGRRGLRNEQDHAREQSHVIREQLKKRWTQEQDQQKRLRDNYKTAADGNPPSTTLVGAMDPEENGSGDDGTTKKRLTGTPVHAVRGRRIKQGKPAPSLTNRKAGKNNNPKGLEPAGHTPRRSSRLAGNKT